MVGDAHSIALPDRGRLRAGRGRLRGLRCIHTHLGGEGLTRDDKTDLLLLRLDAMVTIGVDGDGLPTLAHTAALRPANSDGKGIELLAPLPPAQIELDFQAWVRDLEAELSRTVATREVGDGEIVDVVTQTRPRVDPKTVLGLGKLQDLMIRALQSNIELVIVDQDLTPTQARNLAARMELRVIDRTQLILDIFAQHATSRDGKLQVELAQLKYRLPRLAGGIGGRGPGETKLEVDRRRTRDRVTRLERELRQLGGQRENRRQRRGRRDVPVLSIVGYTNAGKSTLLRALTKTAVHVADKMFSTLDPVSRRLRFPHEREVIITDTVGFIRDLPPDLVTAFHATLEELRDASLLLHVVDASVADCDRRIETVRGILDEIGIEAPELLVFNQIDKLEHGAGKALARRHGGVAVSALERAGLRALLERAEQMLLGRLVGQPPQMRARPDKQASAGNRRARHGDLAQ